MYRTRVSLEAFEQLSSVGEHDNNVKDYSLVVDQITITANHSNYLVCDKSQRSLSLSGKW